LQDHDSAEWNDEASNMGKIYGFAAFTLAITSSSDSNEGFQRVKNTLPSQHEANPKTTMAYHMLRPGPKGLEEARSNSPLDSRGWAFQEERLSPRIIHWTTHGTFWTCLSGSSSEFATNMTWNKPGERTAIFEDFSQPLYQESQDGVEKVTYIDRTWSRLIEAYSLRQFQRIDDRLPALSGLASRYSERYHLQSPEDRYFAGHWLSSLHNSLLWVKATNIPSNMTSITDTSLAIGPSWSWVSVPSTIGIKFPRRHGRPTLKWISYDAQLKGKDEFGAIHMPARLSIKARLKSLLQGLTYVDWPTDERKLDDGYCIFPSIEDNVYALDLTNNRILVSYDSSYPVVIQTDYGMPTNLDHCYCLQINENGFLLLAWLPNEDRYIRVGCANWHEHFHMFDGSDAVTVELT
jgi:hypothetical protein